MASSGETTGGNKKETMKEYMASDSEGVTVSADPAKPRDSLPPWKFKAMLPMISLMAISYGYDIGNVANIQATIYHAMGHIELLPWAALAFCTGNAAVIPIYRKLTNIFNLRLILVGAIIIFAVGAVVSGAAKSTQTLIIGRVITGMGLAGAYQLILSYIAVFAQPREAPRLMGMIGMMWAAGLISGPLIGAAFVENKHATWRWAMYINLPIAAILITGCLFAFPSYRLPNPGSRTTTSRLLEADFIGAVLHIATMVLLAIALTFSGNVWSWKSGSVIAVWIVWGLTVAAYVSQQVLCILTTPERRIFPVHLVNNRAIGLAAMCTCCASGAYAVTLYYQPLFFAFARGYGPIKAAVHLLSFICVFITSAVLGGALLPVIKWYKGFYILGGALILTAGTLMTTMRAETFDSKVLGYEAMMGFGLGLVWFHGVSVATGVLASGTASDRLDASALMNMAQLGSISVGLALAGCLFQNVGFNLLCDALLPFNIPNQSIREALAGVDSPIWTAANHEIGRLAVDAVVKAIARLFYLSVASGAVTFLAAFAMRWEKLEFRPKSG